MTRAVSTVLDVSVCLLLVAAAVLTIATAPVPEQDPAADRAGEAAETLSTATATVNASVDGRERRTRGTLAGLLAAAAVDDAAGGDRSFREAVAAAVRPALRGRDWRGQAVATWRPYRGATPLGTVRLGHRPPPDADVHAASTSVPVARSPSATAAAERDGYRGVAGVVAGTAVDRLFPPGATRAALGGPGRRRTLSRYRALGDRFGVPAERVTRTRGPRRANDRLRAAMADRFVADLRERFATPGAAARAVRVGRVRITVRTWSP